MMAERTVIGKHYPDADGGRTTPITYQDKEYLINENVWEEGDDKYYSVTLEHELGLKNVDSKRDFRDKLLDMLEVIELLSNMGYEMYDCGDAASFWRKQANGDTTNKD